MSGIVVIGAGQAAASLVAKLRALGYEGALTIIGDEPATPYERPPLSKAYLLGEITAERLHLRPDSFYTENNITVRTGTKAAAIDPTAKTVTLEGGESVSYDKLALTTGSHPRRLPASIGGALQGVYTMRTLADADGMAHEFGEGRSVLIIGGGYIGLEAAAVAAKKGMKVTLVEMADRILQRVAAPQTSDYFRALHKAHGVDIREGVGLVRLNGDDHVTSADLTDGTTIGVDFAVVGVGIAPAVELAQAAGLEIDNGIKTDEHCRTSDPDVYAAGDCASFPWKGERIRLESVGNAIDQAEAAAAAMLGSDEPYIAYPWFWSDQYDCALQIAGLNRGYDNVVERRDGDSVSYWYYKGDELLAVDAMNDAKSYMVGKRLLEAGKTADKEKIADPTTNLKALLKG